MKVTFLRPRRSERRTLELSSAAMPAQPQEIMDLISTPRETAARKGMGSKAPPGAMTAHPPDEIISPLGKTGETRRRKAMGATAECKASPAAGDISICFRKLPETAGRKAMVPNVASFA